MHLFAYMWRAIPLFALAFGFSYVAQALWTRSSVFADVAICFLLAFIYLACIVAAWFTPSRLVAIFGATATLLAFGAGVTSAILSGQSNWSQQVQALFVAAVFASICWFTTQALVRVRLAANYSFKRTGAEGLR